MTNRIKNKDIYAIAASFHPAGYSQFSLANRDSVNLKVSWMHIARNMTATENAISVDGSYDSSNFGHMFEVILRLCRIFVSSKITCLHIVMCRGNTAAICRGLEQSKLAIVFTIK